MILNAQNLSLEYRIGKQWFSVIHDVTLAIAPNEIHGLVGESGSGKSTLALALMRYLAPNARYSGGTLHFKGRDLTQLNNADMGAVWGKEIALVPQNPLDALNPTMTIAAQMTEVTRRHLNVSLVEAQQQALDDLKRVKIADPEDVLKRYPHQLSGGMQQRVMIAMALSTNPDLLVLDEPTTALDVTTQAVILDLIRERVKEQNTAVLYVSHNLGTIAQLCDVVTVLYGGEVMETAAVDVLFAHPSHPYTVGLLDSIPKPSQENEARLTTIGGVAPSLSNRPKACVFSDRCPIAVDKCRADKPPVETMTPDHQVRCWRWQEVASGEVKLHNRSQPRSKDVTPTEKTVLQVSNLRKTFESGSWLSRLMKPSPSIVAVEDATFHINAQSTLGIVGESGSGKTTLARAIVALSPADSGEIELLDMPISRALNGRNRDVLGNLRMIFQNPNDALNPYRTVGQAIGRTLELLDNRKDDIPQQIARLLTSVGLAPDYERRYPTQLSGGEKQRVAIARAFAANPALVIADEPTSALDVSVQAVIVNLLKDLRNQAGVSYMIISHDLELIGYLADWIVVLYLGEIVEQGTTAQVYDFPSHPYTEALISAIPIPDRTQRTGNIRLDGEVPSPSNKPTGCPFHTRCPRFIGNICVETVPPVQRDDMGHEIRCHYTMDELVALQTASQPSPQGA